MAQPAMNADHPALQGKLVAAQEAVSRIQPSDIVMWGVFTEPTSLIPAFLEDRERLRGLTMLHETPLLEFPWFSAPYSEFFSVYDCFPGANSREAVRKGAVQFVSVPFGIIRPERADGRAGHLFTRYTVYVTRVTPPDNDGYVSIGTFPWFYSDAFAIARMVIAEIDPTLPATNAKVHASKIDLFVPPPPKEATPPPRRALAVTPPEELEAAQVVGANASQLIRDGDTFQVGVGPASESMVEFLRDRKDLGVHSELIFPTVVELVRDGVITGAKKNVDRGKVVTAGLFANPDDPFREGAMQFIAEHPELFDFRPIGLVANVATVAGIQNIVAVNMILAIDLLGQAVINYLDRTVIAGIGGNFDFTVGAHYAPGGKAVYCMLSTAKGGTVSRVVPLIPRRPYSIVSMPGYMVDYLVTEHGVVNLEGMGARDRAEAIISVADPAFRSDLRRAARRMGIL